MSVATDLTERPSLFGRRLKRWRQLRGLSQFALAEAAGVSARHLGFVEIGRAQPSRALVLRLGAALDLSLRERNALLLAAGFAPAFEARAISEPILSEARRALEQILAQQEPFPAVVMDRGWNIVMRNEAAVRMRRAMVRDDEALAAGEAARNAICAMFHPKLYRPWILNWEEVAADLLMRLRNEAAEAPPDDPAARLLAEVLGYPGAPELRPVELRPNRPLMHVEMRRGDLRIAYFSTLTTFGTPQDLTLQELRLKSFFPPDHEAAETFRRLAAAR
jgi:transcriptional regulator with XRE-family HTH domain